MDGLSPLSGYSGTHIAYVFFRKYLFLRCEWIIGKSSMLSLHIHLFTRMVIPDKLCAIKYKKKKPLEETGEKKLILLCLQKVWSTVESSLSNFNRLPWQPAKNTPDIVSFPKNKTKQNKQKGILVQNKQLNIAGTRLTKPCVRTIERKWCHQEMIGCLTLPNGSWAHLHPFRAPHGSTLRYRMTTLTVSAKPSGEEQRRPRRSLAEVEVHLREWRIKTAPLNGKIEFKVCKPLGVHWS